MPSAVRKTESVIMPAGEYWVGDPCYSVPDERWMEWLEGGKYDKPEGKRFVLADLDGYATLGIGTAFGDGEYPGSDGNYYPVDAGLIGVVPVEVAIAEPFGAQRVTFSKEFTCLYEERGGVIVLGDIRIKTDWDEEEEDW